MNTLLLRNVDTHTHIHISRNSKVFFFLLFMFLDYKSALKKLYQLYNNKICFFFIQFYHMAIKIVLQNICVCQGYKFLDTFRRQLVIYIKS